MNPHSFSNRISPATVSPRVVVVTGASAGIGRAVAREFARHGDNVALLARGETGLTAAAAEVEQAGGRAVTYTVDTSDHHAVDEAAGRIEAEVGPIDVWVNVAFSAAFAKFTEIAPEEFERVTDVTYLGYVNGTRAALRHMLPRDTGVIVQVGSALGHRGIPLQSAYCGAKHALEGFQESLRTELLAQRSNVATTIVEMPAVNTPQFEWVLSRLPNAARPVAPVYQPEVAARAVVFAAAHPRRRAYWVGASTAGTIIANRVVGGLLDRYLAATGIESQQTSRRRDPTRPVNLWKPADGSDGRDYGAHGPFDSESHPRSVQHWISRHRVLVGLGVAAAAVKGATVAVQPRRGQS